MRTAQQDAPDTFRVVSGRVNSDGTIAAGTGFLAQKGGTGVYTVRFTSPVKHLRNIALEVIGGFANVFAILDAPSSDPSFFTVRTYNSATALTDGNWGFTATVVPR